MKIKHFEFNMFPENCYLVWDEESKEAVVIDPGCFYDEEKQTLKRFIEENKLQPVHLLNTHQHLDHIFGNRFVAETYNLQPEGHRADELWIEKAPKQSRMFGFEWNEKTIGIGKYLEDGDTVTFGKYSFTCLHVPGHSPGSLAFYCKEAQCVFAGDALFQGSIGRADLEGGNFDQLIERIETQLLTLPESTVVYPGHGPATTIAAEKKDNPFFRVHYNS